MQSDTGWNSTYDFGTIMEELSGSDREKREEGKAHAT